MNAFELHHSENGVVLCSTDDTSQETHRTPEDTGRRAEVVRAALGVGVVPLLLELHVLHLVANHCKG